MTANEVRALARKKKKLLGGIDGYSFKIGPFEYKVVYSGGLAACVEIRRRMVGKKNYKHDMNMCFDGYKDVEAVRAAIDREYETERKFFSEAKGQVWMPSKGTVWAPEGA